MSAVFFDIDTQFDFMCPSGALYVPGAERILPAVAKLNRHSQANGFLVVSSADVHSESDPEFAHWPPHCIAGTMGQRKPERTLLERRVTLPNRPGGFDLSGAGQIVVEKQTVDVFHTATIGPLLARLSADSYVVYGVVTEICVLHAARGLLQTGKSVTVVTDAIETLNGSHSERALAEIRAAGGRLATVAEICGS